MPGVAEAISSQLEVSHAHGGNGSKAGDVSRIAPAHGASVVGDQPFVAVELHGAENDAKPS